MKIRPVLIRSDAVHPFVHNLIHRRAITALGTEYSGDGCRILSFLIGT